MNKINGKTTHSSRHQYAAEWKQRDLRLIHSLNLFQQKRQDAFLFGGYAILNCCNRLVCFCREFIEVVFARASIFFYLLFELCLSSCLVGCYLTLGFCFGLLQTVGFSCIQEDSSTMVSI